MKLCPCGFYGDEVVQCQCSPAKVRNYAQRISGPLLDRIDIHVGLQRPPSSDILNPVKGTSSDVAKRQVARCRQRQIERQGCLNSALQGEQIHAYVALAKAQQTLLEQAAQKLTLSPRALHKILRVARTLADLDDADKIDKTYILEALSYRQLER